MIRAVGLSRRFGANAVLDGLDLHVAPGERVALLGLNGAGKTTLMRCLLGLIAYDGRLEVHGADVQAAPRRARAAVGYVPQRAPHFDGTLGDVVGFFSRLRGVDPAATEQQMAALGLSLDAHGTKAVPTLSGGMLQKALLGLALAADVPVLLLDEPTANLDARARGEFLRALRQVPRTTTVFLASHRLTDVEAVADRLVVLHGGRIAFDGTMQELWRRVGTAETLWVRVPPASRDDALARVRAELAGETIRANGTVFGVQVAHDARADVLALLRRDGIPVEDFWTEAPSLTELLEGALGLAPSEQEGTRR